MPQDGYPHLVDVVYGPAGCVLILTNGARLQLEITGAALGSHLQKCGFPGLDEICRAKSAEVLYRPLEMTEAEWDKIAAILKDSKSPALDAHPGFRSKIRLTFSEVCALPLRVYGGVGRGDHATLYVGHPCDFRRDTARKGPWFRGLLHAPGGHLLNAVVNLRTGASEMSCGVLAGHHIEG